MYITAFIERSVLAVYSGQMCSCIQNPALLCKRVAKCSARRTWWASRVKHSSVASHTTEMQTSRFEIVYLSCIKKLLKKNDIQLVPFEILCFRMQYYQHAELKCGFGLLKNTVYEQISRQLVLKATIFTFLLLSV